MVKLLPFEEDGEVVGYFFDCPGCGGGHAVHVRPHKNPVTGASWAFNGNLDKPTFNPSVLSRVNYSDPSKPYGVCHLFVNDGKIQFLSDCTHDLAGKTVDIPDQDFV